VNYPKAVAPGLIRHPESVPETGKRRRFTCRADIRPNATYVLLSHSGNGRKTLAFRRLRIYLSLFTPPHKKTPRFVYPQRFDFIDANSGQHTSGGRA